MAQLASAGFDGTAVYDEAIVAQEPGNVAPVGPVFDSVPKVQQKEEVMVSSWE